MKTALSVIGLLIAALAVVLGIRYFAGVRDGADSQTFVYCSEGSPSVFNPQMTTDGPSFAANSASTMDGLIRFKYGGTTLEPALAESWEVSDDKKSYTFKLKRGIKFHTTAYFTPTREFNADDVVFSVDRQRLPDHPYHKVGGGIYEYFQSMGMGDLIADVQKIDDYTVRFVLSRPEAPFLANLSMHFMNILSKEYADKLAAEGRQEDFDHYPVGTGAFVFESYAQDTLIRYKAHPDYWEEGFPKIQNLVFAITPDASVRLQKLRAGECHLIPDPAPADLAAIGEDASLTLFQQPGLNVGFLALNTEKPPLDNLQVRRALNHALDRQSYIDAIYLGNAQVAKNPLPPTMWSYDESIEDYAYDVEKAKALLAEAGHADGFDIELWTMPVTRPYNPNGKKMGEMMQADLAKVGVRARLVTYDWPTYIAKGRRSEHQLLQLGWIGDNGDPDNFLNYLLGCDSVQSGANWARWCDKGFNDLVTRAREAQDVAERTRLYQEAQKIFKEAAPWVPIAHSTMFRAGSKRIEGYRMQAVGSPDSFRYVELK